MSAGGTLAAGLGGWDVAALAGAALGAALYALGLARLWRRAGWGRGVGVAGAVGCFAGWAVLAAALGPPLAPLADLLFAAHMGQHELIMLVAPPLLVLGRPWQVALWALPAPWRRAVGRLLRRRGPAAAWRRLTSPAAILLLQAAVLWLWHLPAAFEAALAHDALHVVQHLCFFATAGLFWWSLVHGRFGRLGYGVGVLFVFATALHSGALGALLTVVATPLYPTHAARAAAAGADPLADQQLAGLLMWVPAAVVLLVSALALFAAWLGQAARRGRWTRAADLAARRSDGVR